MPYFDVIFRSDVILSIGPKIKDKLQLGNFVIKTNLFTHGVESKMY